MCKISGVLVFSFSLKVTSKIVYDVVTWLSNQVSHRKDKRRFVLNKQSKNYISMRLSGRSSKTNSVIIVTGLVKIGKHICTGIQ